MKPPAIDETYELLNHVNALSELSPMMAAGARQQTTGPAHLFEPAPPDGFWRRQFAPEGTLAQLIFDVTAGLIAPLLCLLFDPIVFRTGGFGPPVFGAYKSFAYAVICIEITTLVVWLLFGPRLKAYAGVVGGVLLAGALFSLVIGCALLPFSLLGLMFGLGLFGFTPFITSLIYLRNGRRALWAAGLHLRPAHACAAMLLGALCALGGPALVHWQLTHVLSLVRLPG